MPYTATREIIVKIQPKGLFTIPKKLRAGLFEENGFARVRKEKRRLVIEPVRMLSYPVRSYTNDEIDEFLNLDQEEAKKLK